MTRGTWGQIMMRGTFIYSFLVVVHACLLGNALHSHPTMAGDVNFDIPDILPAVEQENLKAKDRGDRLTQYVNWSGGGSFDEWRRLGHSQRKKGHLTRAEYSFRKALILSVAADDRKQQTIISLELGSIYFMMGELNKSARFFQKSLELAEKNNDRLNGIMARFNMSLLERQTGQAEEAEKLLAEAREKISLNDNGQLRAKILFNHGRILRELNKTKQASSTLKYVISLSEEKGLEDISAAANAELAALKKDVVPASLPQTSQPGKTLLPTVEDRDAIANVYSQLGSVHLKRREYDLAKDMFKRALSINKDAGNTLEQARQHMLLAKLFERLGDNFSVCKNVQDAKELSKNNDTNKIWKKIHQTINDFKCNKNEDTGLAWAKAQLGK